MSSEPMQGTIDGSEVPYEKAYIESLPPAEPSEFSRDDYELILTLSMDSDELLQGYDFNPDGKPYTTAEELAADIQKEYSTIRHFINEWGLYCDYSVLFQLRNRVTGQVTRATWTQSNY